jgi:predicted DCC family thiol-disulfide oxidoreductase YuxK
VTESAHDPGSSSQPGLPLLVFDGDCGFCTTWARWWQRRWDLEHVEPWQFLDLDRLGLTEAECREAVQWVDEAGVAHPAEWAVIAALRFRGGVWGVLGRVLALPGIHHLTGVAYRLVARYRNSLPGGTPACKVGGGPGG